ncbi:MAG TPA: HD domain-containing phosphohydrolase, partial [Tepiditoga sp.]|nr:HD domain-containing phosphohydrolase [Tepiditoga sp.]
SGYPQGLKNNEIPLESRIMTIADSWDAMTRDRIYRKALSKEEAIEELVKNKGVQFDPDLVEIFINIVK